MRIWFLAYAHVSFGRLKLRLAATLDSRDGSGVDMKNSNWRKLPAHQAAAFLQAAERPINTQRLRNIYARFEVFLRQKPHGYCVR
jgi:hypothetical protein